MRKRIGSFEFAILQSILELEEPNGSQIHKHLETKIGKPVNSGALHTVLMRLEQKKFLIVRIGTTEPGRGGRPPKFYTLTEPAQNTIKNMIKRDQNKNKS